MLLYAVGGLVFFPCDAPDSEGECEGTAVVCYCGGYCCVTCDIHCVVPLSALLGSA